MCYHTLDALVIQALQRRWICDPTPPRWFEWFFAEKPQKSSAIAYKHKDCSDAIGSQIKWPRSSYHRSIQAVITPYVFSHGRIWGALHCRFYGDTKILVVCALCFYMWSFLDSTCGKIWWNVDHIQRQVVLGFAIFVPSDWLHPTTNFQSFSHTI